MRLTPCRQYEPLRNSLISCSSVKREMCVVPTVTWDCPPTVMGLWVEVKASSLTADVSSYDIPQMKISHVSCAQVITVYLCTSYLSGLRCGTERWFKLLLLFFVQLGEPLRPQRGARQSLAEDGVHRGGFEPANKWREQVNFIVFNGKCMKNKKSQFEFFL